jgi:hypothetical protein
MGKLNKAWHERHPMPAKATREERVRWHVAHAEACGCRPMPKSLEALARRGNSVRASKNRRAAAGSR